MASFLTADGYEVLIDAEDLHLVAGRRFSTSVSRRSTVRYASTSSGKGRVLLHRMILCPGMGVDVDHANGDGLDNRRANLRTCTRAQNIANVHRVRRDNQSGLRGVRFHPHLKSRPWRARIRYENKTIDLGYFATSAEAAKAYDAEAIRLYGEFAGTNARIAMGLEVKT